MDTDRNLLFGALALEAGTISATQLAEAYGFWRRQPSEPLGDLLLKRGWITPRGKEELETAVAKKMAEHGGNSSHALRTVVTDPVRDAIIRTGDAGLFAATMDDPTAIIDAPPVKEDPHGATLEEPTARTGDVPVKEDAHATTLENPIGELPGVARNEAEQGSKLDRPTTGAASRVRVVETVDFRTESRSRYTLTRVHGKGGLGQVWLAVDEHLKRQIALKELRPERGDRDGSRRLVREAQITGQLEHPNIVPVYELAAGPDAARPFYTMKFLRGDTLAERIDAYHKRRTAGSADPIELRQLLNAFVDVCNAIRYAHSRGIIHRDIKPANVLLGDFGEVIVLDWGLAKSVDQPDDDQRPIVVSDSIEATHEGKVLGTPAYMAPEQADGQIAQMDAKTDIYGLGAVLFAILSGNAPHRLSSVRTPGSGGAAGKTSAMETAAYLRQISTGPTPQLIESAPWSPPPLDAICSKAMAKKRSERYETAAELAADVERWLADEPVSVYRDPWQERARRSLRRHRALARAIAAALVIVAIVATVSAVVVNASRRQVERALAAETDALGTAEAALESERAARAEATRRFREARNAVDKSLTGVSEVLTFFPGVEPLRLELLEEAARDLEQLANERSDDVDLRAESGRALIRLGDVRQLTGKNDAALKAYRAAAKLFGELSLEAPDRPEFVVEQAHNQTRLGVLFTTIGPHDDAMQAFDSAESTLGELVSRFPDEANYRHTRAGLALNRATLLQKVGDLSGARKVLESAAAELTVLAKSGAAAVGETLAHTERELGFVLYALGRSDEAVAKLRSAIATFGRLCLQRPDHPPHVQGLAAARVSLANILRPLGRDREAAEEYRAAIDDFAALLRSRPGVPVYREDLALTRTNLAQLLYTAGRCPEAKAEGLEALRGIDELTSANPDVHRYQEELATTTVVLGLILRDLNEDELAGQAIRGAIDRLDELSAIVRDAPVYRLRQAVATSTLARTQFKAGNLPAAKDSFQAALDQFAKVLRDLPDNPHVLDAQAWCETHFGDALRQAGSPQDAESHYSRARSIREKLIDEPEHLHNRAWLLAMCDDPQFRDPAAAVRAAEQAKSRAIENGRYWFVLGLAQIRAERFSDAVKSLEQANRLHGDENSFHWFALALAHWRLADKETARTCFDRGDKLMQKNRPGNIDLQKLRREVEEAMRE